MKNICRYIQLKERIYIQDFTRVLAAVGYIMQCQKKWETVKYQNEIIKTLTTVKHPLFFHRRKLNEILKESGFYGKKKTDKTIDEIKNDIDSLISKVSALIKHSPKIIREEFTDKDIQSVVSEIQKNQVRHYLEMCFVTHNPKYYEELKKMLNRLNVKNYFAKDESRKENKVISMAEVLRKRNGQ